jgi:hypothetical protein
MGEYFAGRRGFDLLGDETWVKDETTKRQSYESRTLPNCFAIRSFVVS